MKTVLISASIVGITLAEPPALLRRQDTDISGLSTKCINATFSLLSAVPTPPAALPEFSLSYYETASRTATDLAGECGWITEIPEALYTDVADYNRELLEWLQDDDTEDLFEEIMDECEERQSTVTPCNDEWDALETMIFDKTGIEPLQPDAGDDGDGDEGEDEGAGEDEDEEEEANDDSGSVVVLDSASQTLTFAALMATFAIGVVFA